MCLLDLVEQYDGMRHAAYPFRELAAFPVADVAGGCPDHLRDAVPFHELAHVQPDEAVSAAEKFLGDDPRDQGLADAGRT